MSTNLKVDCASRITLANSKEIVFDIEMQVSKNQKPLMGSRLPHYGEYLCQLKFNGDEAKCQARKAFATALCMWNCDETNKFGVIWGTPRECFTSTESNAGVEYPDIKFPVCCVRIFLGRTVRALEVVKTKLESVGHLIDNAAEYKSALDEACKSRSTELESKFNQLWGTNISIDNLRSELIEFIKTRRKKVEKNEGYEESDFSSDQEFLEKFKKVEAFELMQLIAASSAMSSEKVEQICSKKVRSMYEYLKISEENIMDDVLLEKECEWMKSIQAAQTKEAIKEAAFRIAGCFIGNTVVQADQITQILNEVAGKYPNVTLERRQVIKEVKGLNKNIHEGNNGLEFIPPSSNKQVKNNKRHMIS